MAWLANDFAQERLWKMTAASQICRRAAFTSRLRVEEQHQHLKLKKVAYSLAKAVMQFWHSAEAVCKELEIQKPVKNIAHAIRGYALRFLKYNSSPVPSLQEEVPVTPERIADLGMMDISEYDHLTEFYLLESLFFAVSSAAMALYRLSIESHIMQSEKTHNSMQEEVDTCMYDTPADFGCHDNAYGDEGR
ncbi:CHROMATIN MODIFICATION-RELATED PROTEIN EAF1 A-RELATED [Salix purpurea]|uniref:CHROMATIN MODIFICATION-RELATED PROTEIN EAF1 A-RELATED n=1 Tax=Salix purpurea TaxID=77065 RepID=A0A9Q1A9B9_SALPP|nr:CHROMATIN MODIFICATION-RELATED PROTEIN EAF1 A-RELATED [Salix purpurea]